MPRTRQLVVTDQNYLLNGDVASEGLPPRTAAPRLDWSAGPQAEALFPVTQSCRQQFFSEVCLVTAIIGMSVLKFRSLPRCLKVLL